ncbi:MAG: hypothetical protein HY072_07685 [Deltaproteobacteria bacterium]|nr:hypothetical protein [Deltaproteobacteria bacterium]
MVVHLEDFYFRRLPLFLAQKDHGLSWAHDLGSVWGQELGVVSDRVSGEVDRLKQEISAREFWRQGCSS